MLETKIVQFFFTHSVDVGNINVKIPNLMVALSSAASIAEKRDHVTQSLFP